MMKHTANNTQICCGNGLSRISSCGGTVNIVKHFSRSPPLTVCTSEFCLYSNKNQTCTHSQMWKTYILKKKYIYIYIYINSTVCVFDVCEQVKPSINMQAYKIVCVFPCICPKQVQTSFEHLRQVPPGCYRFPVVKCRMQEPEIL